MTYVREIDISSGDFNGSIFWPEAARTKFCHDEERNVSVIFFFHYGLFSILPQSHWYLDFAKRRAETHYPLLRRHRWMAPSTDLAKLVWPDLIAQLLPKRPLILLSQSSLWDGMAILENLVQMRVSQMKDSDAQKQFAAVDYLAANLSDWRWLERASEFLRFFEDGLQARGFSVASSLWRNNPNCPAHLLQGSVLMKRLNGHLAEVIAEETRKGHEPWSQICLVDWRKHLEIHRPEQCDTHHFTKEKCLVFGHLWQRFKRPLQYFLFPKQFTVGFSNGKKVAALVQLCQGFCSVKSS